MIVAAGVMIVAPCPVGGADTVLFLLRRADNDHPFEWCFPGGRVEDGETVAQGAARETEEECGLVVDPKDLGEPLTRSVTRAETPAAAPTPEPIPAEKGTGGGLLTESEARAAAPKDVDFTTYVHRVDRQFTPVLCDEHVGHCWAPLAHPPAPTHPGCTVALERQSMDELGVARAMAAGRLVSPQVYENMALFAIRITATGAAYRTGLGEYVWRDKEIYLNEDFLARCAGLPVIWEHPTGSTLNAKEYSDRVIGAVMFAYIVGEDVWAIARIYDQDSSRAMTEKQISTSPAVVFFKDNPGNERATLEDGSKVLIEGKPDLLDHIAICANGVWDKGGEPTGVDRTAATAPGEAMMADEDVRDDVLKTQKVTEKTNAMSGRLRTGTTSKTTWGVVNEEGRVLQRGFFTKEQAQAWINSRSDASKLATTECNMAEAMADSDFRGRALSLRARSLGLRARN